MRNERRIGGPVSDSTGDRELRESFAVAMAGIARSVGVVAPGAPHAALDQQLEVDRATLVEAEAIVEGVAQIVEAEMPRAAGIGAVQERAVVACLGHKQRPGSAAAMG